MKKDDNDNHDNSNGLSSENLTNEIYTLCFIKR